MFALIFLLSSLFSVSTKVMFIDEEKRNGHCVFSKNIYRRKHLINLCIFSTYPTTFLSNVVQALMYVDVAVLNWRSLIESYS